MGACSPRKMFEVRCLGSHLVASQTHCNYRAKSNKILELFMIMVYMPLCNLVSTGLNLLLFGKFKNLGGDISPPKGPEKITAYLISVCYLDSVAALSVPWLGIHL